MTAPTIEDRSAKAITPEHYIVIIGAGLGGIAAGIRFQEAGLDDFVMLDRADDIGGTWRMNTYPGVAVDIPSVLYQYSFEKKTDWSRVFARGAEIKSYADDLVDKYGLRPRIRLNTEVTKLEFDEDNDLWRISTGATTLTTRFVVNATGVLSNPKLPDIAGLDTFAGKTMHTAAWDHDFDLSGKRVAVIGTGATSVQLLPEIAPIVDTLDVYQRTPIWIFPKVDFPLGRFSRGALRQIPLLQDTLRFGVNAGIEVGFVLGISYNRQLHFISRAIEGGCRTFLRTQVSDPVLREKLTPKYGFGCKRPTMSNDYLRNYTRENVELITEGIDQVTPTGIRTIDGVDREIDVLVLATGYYVTDPEAFPFEIVGRNGTNLVKFWQENRFHAYEGATLPDFPNAFLTFGPYAFGGFSFLSTIENQTTHILRVLTEARKRGATRVQVRQQPTDEFFQKMLKRQRNSIFFNNSCEASNSYYFDSNGDVPALRLGSTLEAYRRSRTFPLTDYEFTANTTLRTVPVGDRKERTSQSGRRTLDDSAEVATK